MNHSQDKDYTYTGTYKVVKIGRKSAKRTVLERGLTAAEAQRLVSSHPNSTRSIVVYFKQYSADKWYRLDRKHIPSPSSPGGSFTVVRRWLMVHKESGQPATARQGRWTFDSPEAAQEHIDELVKHTDAETMAQVFPQGLRVAAWWCYDGHHDPMEPVRAGE